VLVSIGELSGPSWTELVVARARLSHCLAVYILLKGVICLTNLAGTVLANQLPGKHLPKALFSKGFRVWLHTHWPPSLKLMVLLL